VAGNLVNSSTDVRLVIARLLPSGALDTTFGDLAGDGGTRLGYIVYNPGAGDQTKYGTSVFSVRIDSKGRILLLNARWIASVGPFCDTEVGRWTTDGDLDTTFTRFSGGINGFYCGVPYDLRVLSNDDAVVLANWNIYTGAETVMQLFNATDGSR